MRSVASRHHVYTLELTKLTKREVGTKNSLLRQFTVVLCSRPLREHIADLGAPFIGMSARDARQQLATIRLQRRAKVHHHHRLGVPSK